MFVCGHNVVHMILIPLPSCWNSWCWCKTTSKEKKSQHFHVPNTGSLSRAPMLQQLCHLANGQPLPMDGPGRTHKPLHWEWKQNHPWKEVVGSWLLKSDSSRHTSVLHEAPCLWNEAESKMPRDLAIWDVSLMDSGEKQKASQRTKCVLEKKFSLILKWLATVPEDRDTIRIMGEECVCVLSHTLA